MEVTVYLDTDQDLYHTSYVYAGIFGLAAENGIELELKSPTLHTWRKPGTGSTYVSLDVVAPNGTVIPVAIDLRDRSDLFDRSALENVGVYFKRSHHLADVASLPPDLGAKVLPFGMNFVCSNVPSAKAVSAQILRRIASRVSGRTGASGSIKTLARKLYDYWTYRRESDYTASPDTPRTAAVLFQTRIWEDHEALGDDPNAINDQRVLLVRALKEALGDRFCGGLVPTPLALRRYPELVTGKPSSPAAYARWQRSLLIGVYTRGLHFSTAWKLGEYFAASMCVVAERPRNQLPVPLNEGAEFLAFDSADECIAACESVLVNPELQRRMRAAAHDYYQREIAPMAHLRSCLARAVARENPVATGS